MRSMLTTLAWIVFWVADAGTFIFLTFFDGYVYNWWNWMIALPINLFLSQIWPLYWLVLRPLFE